MRTAAERLWGAAPVDFFFDNFNRADGAVGNGWTSRNDPPGTPFQISSNQVVQPGTPHAGGDCVRTLPFVPNLAQFTIGTITDNSQYFYIFIGIDAGTSDSDWTGVAFEGAAGSWTIYLATGGTFLSRSTASAARSGGVMTFTRSLNGSSQWVYTGKVNGVTVVTWTDTGHTADFAWGSVTGFIIGNSSGGIAAPTADDFSATI